MLVAKMNECVKESVLLIWGAPKGSVTPLPHPYYFPTTLLVLITRD